MLNPSMDEDNVNTDNQAFSSKNQVKVLIRVRYAECDAQQIVFNARYADYADLAATEYMRALYGKHQNLVDQGYDTRVVNMNIDWFAPALFDDILTLTIQCEHIGNTSFGLVTQCTKQTAEGEHIHLATMRVRYVVIDTDSLTKTAIPDFLRDQLQREFDITCNQAG